MDFDGVYNDFNKAPVKKEKKITKIVAIRRQVLSLKCTEFEFGWGFAPDPTGVDYSAPSTHSWI